MSTPQLTTPPLVCSASGPADPAASALARLVHPLTPHEFVTTYWCARPVLLTGWPQRHTGLFDLGVLRAAVARQSEAGLSIRVSDDHRGDDGGAGRHRSIQAGQIAEHLRRGASVCVDPIDRAVPTLRRLATDLSRELRHAGEVSVKCYLSPDGYGFNTHFDAHVVTTLQIEGSKRWRIGRRPGVPHPVDNAFLDAAGGLHYMHRMPSAVRAWERAAFDPADGVEIVLQPGDVLCLPAGTWHEAKAEGSSLALNLAFAAPDLLALIADAARARLQDRPSWRAGLPVAPGTRSDEVPRPVSDALRAQLALLSAVLAEPRFAEELDRAWLTRVTGEPTDGAVPAPTTAARAATEPARAAARVQCVLTVADAPRAAAWYRRVLGFAPVATIPEYGWIELATTTAGCTVGLTEDTTSPAPRLSLAVDDLAAVRSALLAAGARVDAEHRVIAGVARFLTAEDPDGNRLMFFESTNPAEPEGKPNR